MSSNTTLAPEQRQRLRRALLDKGAELATLLTQLMAGKTIQLFHLPLASGEHSKAKKEERLRSFLKLVTTQRQLLEQGAEDFGRCQRCQLGFSFEELWEAPWITRCQACAAKAEGE